MNKRILILFSFIFLCLFVFVPQVFASQSISVYVDGEKVNFDNEPIVENATTLVQFKPIFKELGLQVGWDAENQVVTGSKSGLNIELKINSKEATVNGESKNINVAPKIVSNHTMVPIRFVSEASNKQVSWNGKQRIIQIGKKVNIEPQTFFRNTRWGMSKNEVKKAESEKLIGERGNYLVYETQINNLDAAIVYEFYKNQLARAGYMIREKHTNKTQYINDYESIKNKLTKKYGKPSFDEKIWKNDLYKYDPSKWGMAIITGDLKYLAEWNTQNTKICLLLNGDNFEINFGIFYYSKKYLDELNQQEEKNVLENL